VMNDVSETLRSCTQLGMEQGYGKADWQMYTAERRNLRFQQQQRELRRCTGTCYSPRSSCCMLDSSFCAGKCNNCACDRRLDEKQEIEEVLANEFEHSMTLPNVKHRNAVIEDCVAKMEELRTSLLAQPTSNLCLGTSFHENKSPSPISCNVFSSEF
jgi:hypothetical protein